jgi:hypothetical protein
VRDHPPAPDAKLDLVEIGRLMIETFRSLGEACRTAEAAVRMFVAAAEAAEAAEAADTSTESDLPPGDPLAHARPPEEAPAPKPATAATPKPGKPQVFKTTSFWRMVDGGDIFQVAGGVEAPAKTDADFVKITRDEFNSLKRAGADERTWPFSDQEPEPTTDDEDEDDGSGLI